MKRMTQAIILMVILQMEMGIGMIITEIGGEMTGMMMMPQTLTNGNKRNQDHHKSA